MYLRRKKARAGYVLQLLDSYRNHEGKPRHRVILSLGNAPIPKSDWSVIAKGVEQRLKGQDVLFPEEVSDSVRGWIESIVKRIDTKTHEPSSQIVLPRGTTIPELKIDNNDTIDGVLVNEINHSHTTRLGPELLGIHAYECLKIDDVLIQNGFNHAQRQVARASIINRLVDPVAEKALPSWVQFSSLPDLCGEDLFTASKDRYYRVSDKLLEHQKEMESHLRKRQRQLFNLSRTIFLYDLTNSHFEGKSEKNPKARYGKNKQKRDDCPQVVVGLILDGDGFPMAHKMFEGNQADAKTLVEMVKEMQKSIPEGEEPLFNNKPIVIVDAGVATKYNLQNLREAGFHYLVNDSRRGRKRYLEQFQQEERFETICGRDGKSPVRVAKFIDPDVTVDNSTTITDENAIDTCAREGSG
jgi:hypothetical protein